MPEPSAPRGVPAHRRVGENADACAFLRGKGIDPAVANREDVRFDPGRGELRYPVVDLATGEPGWWKCRPLTPRDGQLKHRYEPGGVSPLPWILDDPNAAAPDVVAVCEGETDALACLTHCSTLFPDATVRVVGMRSASTFGNRGAVGAMLNGVAEFARVFVLADADDAGRKAAGKVCKQAHALRGDCSYLVVDVSSDAGNDLCDLLASPAGPAAARQRIARATRWIPDDDPAPLPSPPPRQAVRQSGKRIDGATKQRLRDCLASEIQQRTGKPCPTTPNAPITCPLPDHDDRKPSATVHVDDGVWNCHGCGKGGDVFKLLELTDGSAVWLENARTLGERYGIEVDTNPALNRSVPATGRTEAPGGTLVEAVIPPVLPVVSGADCGFVEYDPVDMLRRPRRIEDYVVQGLFEAGRSTLLHSPGGLGKSLLMLDIAWRVAAGFPVLGIATGEPQGVLYIDVENDPELDLQPRLHALQADADAFEGNLSMGTFNSPNLGSLEQMAAVEAMVTKRGIRLIVLDTAAEAFQMDENSRAEVTNVMAKWRKLAGRTSAHVVIIGHDRKVGDTYTGSTAFQNAASTVLHLQQREEESPTPGVKPLMLSIGKNRGKMTSDPFHIDKVTSGTDDDAQTFAFQRIESAGQTCAPVSARKRRPAKPPAATAAELRYPKIIAELSKPDSEGAPREMAGSAIAATVGGNRAEILAQLRQMAEQGVLVWRQGQRNADLYRRAPEPPT